MHNTNAEKFYNLLYYAEFDKAQDMVRNLNIDELWNLMVAINFPEPTFVSYGYIISLLIQEEKAEYHYLASRILIELLKKFEGAYASGYWHATRAVELNPTNITYQELLLSFYLLPHQLLEKEEAQKLSNKILALDPNNLQAQKIQSMV